MQLAINNLNWSVNFVNKEELDEDDDSRVFGNTSVDNLQINIDKSLPVSLIKRTIIHELTHATLFSYGFIGDLLNEEMICNFVETHIEFIYTSAIKILEGLFDESN